MRKTIHFLILAMFSYNSLTAQQSISETEKLASLGKIYGYLKYYHPEVANGKFDLDMHLINHIPKVLEAKDKISLSTVYMDWINSLGDIKACKKCNSKEAYFDKNFNLSWIQDTTLHTHELISKLKYIENNRNQGENFYVTTEPVGNIKVTNETTYEGFKFPKEEYRLLGLFKYWNIIEYFYPYKYLTDQDWDSVLREVIPKIKNASNKIEYQNSLKELIAKLDDSHAWISFDKVSSYKYIPAKITHIENNAVISGFYNDSIAYVNNLKLGDIILKIQENDVHSEVERKLKFISGSNKTFKINRAYDEIFNGIEDSIQLTVVRGEEIKEIKVKTYYFSEFNYLENKRKIKSKSLTENIGYINMASNFNKNDIDEIFKSFEYKKSIILDLRNYPELKYRMFTKYLNSTESEFYRKYSPSINYPGRFIFDKPSKTLASKNSYKGKVIILVNEESISLSEFTAMAFQTADNAITVGSQTAGTDGRNIIIEYLGGYKTAFTGYGILYPDGSESQRKGVKIDIEIKPTIYGLIQGRDEVLEKAIEIAEQ